MTLLESLHLSPRAWWRRRQIARAWRKAGPGVHIVMIAQALHSSPELRSLFRDALFGKTAEAVNPARREKRAAAKR